MIILRFKFIMIFRKTKEDKKGKENEEGKKEQKVIMQNRPTKDDCLQVRIRGGYLCGSCVWESCWWRDIFVRVCGHHCRRYDRYLRRSICKRWGDWTSRERRGRRCRQIRDRQCQRSRGRPIFQILQKARGPKEKSKQGMKQI